MENEDRTITAVLTLNKCNDCKYCKKNDKLYIDIEDAEEPLIQIGCSCHDSKLLEDNWRTSFEPETKAIEKWNTINPTGNIGYVKSITTTKYSKAEETVLISETAVKVIDLEGKPQLIANTRIDEILDHIYASINYAARNGESRIYWIIPANVPEKTVVEISSQLIYNGYYVHKNESNSNVIEQTRIGIEIAWIKKGKIYQ